MAIKYLLLIIITSCGPNIRLKENILESVSPLTPLQVASYQKEGILINIGPGQIKHSDKTYTVSVYSSKLSRDFIAEIPTGSEVAIIFTGGFKDNQVVVETIQKK